ncbi:MAG TPA: hypothetical protein VFO01_12005 [Trebonia sp.]|nr:hypothetical protein [Trebonia sp.]
MPVPPASPQDTQAAVAVVAAVIFGWCVIYWRTALKVALIVILILVVYGVAAGLHGASALLATHHR